MSSWRDFEVLPWPIERMLTPLGSNQPHVLSKGPGELVLAGVTDLGTDFLDAQTQIQQEVLPLAEKTNRGTFAMGMRSPRILI